MDLEDGEIPEDAYFEAIQLEYPTYLDRLQSRQATPQPSPSTAVQTDTGSTSFIPATLSAQTEKNHASSSSPSPRDISSRIPAADDPQPGPSSSPARIAEESGPDKILGPEALQNPSYPFTDPQTPLKHEGDQSQPDAPSNKRKRVATPKLPPRPKEKNPYVFGHVFGSRVGQRWTTRYECSRDGVHAPTQAGIHGGKEGAYSVVLSGGYYEDDRDYGDTFTYTGTGGRDNTSANGKRSFLKVGASQTSDQSFEHHHNKALKASAATRNPVRVIRGHKLASTYAPAWGYRYDGLYRVTDARLESGTAGKLVCKFSFERIHDDGDYDIPLKPAPEATPARKRRKGKGKDGEVQVKDDPDPVGERDDDDDDDAHDRPVKRERLDDNANLSWA